MGFNKALTTLGLLSTAMMLFSAPLQAAELAETEARVICADGNCFFGKQNAAVNQLQRLPEAKVRAERVNLFSPSGQEPRELVERATAQALAPIGVIENKTDITLSGVTGRFRATAFMVSPCLILANHHQVFGDNFSPDRTTDHSVRFKVGYNAQTGFAGATTAHAVEWGDRSVSDDNDWVLLRLEYCAGARADIGWVDLDPTSSVNLVGREISIAGFPTDKSDKEMWKQDNCRVRSLERSRNYLMHDCANVPGMSGSPIYTTNASGQISVIGLSKGHRKPTTGVLRGYDDDHANLAVSIYDVLNSSRIAQLIRDDISRPQPALPSQVGTSIHSGGN